MKVFEREREREREREGLLVMNERRHNWLLFFVHEPGFDFPVAEFEREPKKFGENFRRKCFGKQKIETEK